MSDQCESGIDGLLTKKMVNAIMANVSKMPLCMTLGAA
jgi:hypothetical protein